MPRTNTSNVGTLIPIDPLIPVDAAISTANELVTEKCLNKGYTEDRMELIERYLAAHFYAFRSKQTESEKVDVITVKYMGKTGLGLNYTPWGQTAMSLDTAGGLYQLNTGAVSIKLGITHLGKLSLDQERELNNY